MAVKRHVAVWASIFLASVGAVTFYIITTIPLWATCVPFCCAARSYVFNSGCGTGSRAGTTLWGETFLIRVLPSFTASQKVLDVVVLIRLFMRYK